MSALHRIVLLLAAAMSLAASRHARAEELIVSAAASLTNAFREIGAEFERARPGVKVVFNFAASGPLLTQIEQGAPADILACADEESMDRGEAKKLIAPGSRRDFASNRLVLVQPRNAPVLRRVEDLAQSQVRRIAVGNPVSVPAGRYAHDALKAMGLWDALQPRFIPAASVRQVLDYVARGEVDAGFVYATDAATAAGKLRVVADIATRPVRYPAAVTAASKRPPLAAGFVEHLRSPAAQAVLAKHGFGPP